MYRPTTPSTRWILRAASVLVFLAASPLLLAGDQTARFFAWTINPQITAAFLGSSYLAAGIFQLLSSRERTWGRARLAVPAVLVFTALTLIVTLVHINRFHFDLAFTDPDARPTELLTVVGTWIWLAIYAVVPIALAIILVRQLREPGTDPPVGTPMGPAARWIVMAHAALLAVAGLALLLVPTAAAPLWPWKLTALTARAIGAWLVGLSITGIQAIRENDSTRFGPAGVAAVTWAILELAVVAGFAGSIDWTKFTTWVYVIVLFSVVAIGASAIYAGTRSRPQAPAGGDGSASRG